MTAAIIFLLTYIGVALGRVPGLMLDRTGIALLGAIAMVIFGAVSIDQSVQAINIPTILLLYALMIVSAQLRLGGFYTWVVMKSTRYLSRPRLFLLVIMGLSGVLSAVLANDIVCLAFTPVILLTVRSAGRNPVPFLLGLVASSNIGSAATIIGNPQNMLIGQMGNLHFAEFLMACAPPAALSLICAYGIICRLCRKFLDGLPDDSARPDHSPANQPNADVWPDFNQWQSVKGLMAAVVLGGLFFTSIPREFSAIAVAGVLLCSRKMRSRSILELVDWHLITLFCALFVVIQGIVLYGIPEKVMAFLGDYGVNFQNLAVLTGVSTLMSNLVSNVPAVLLLIQFIDPADPTQWHVLALSSTFAGNLILLGSIANLIVAEQAKRFNVTITFKDHARIGIPVTVASLLILFVWISVMPV